MHQKGKQSRSSVKVIVRLARSRAECFFFLGYGRL